MNHQKFLHLQNRRNVPELVQFLLSELGTTFKTVNCECELVDFNLR